MFFPPDRGRDFFFSPGRGRDFFFTRQGDNFFSKIQETIFFSKAIKAEQCQ